jgi:hypothetical protein
MKNMLELFAEQVKSGNRLNTHLNNVEFKNVIEKFKEKTGMQYIRMQFNNKLSKLKAEYSCWKTLLRQMSLGWDEMKQNINMPESWWKKARKVSYFLDDNISFMCYVRKYV